MVTRTIYTDASMVVINIGKSALPWLQETTYLLDPANGKTTRTQAQTVMPTPGVTESNIVYPATSIINGSLIYTVITEATGVVTSIIGTTTYPYPVDLINLEASHLSSSPTVTSASSTSGPATTTTTASPAATTSASSPAGPSAPPTVTIVMGLAGGVFCLLLVGTAYFFYRRSQRRKNSEKDSLDSDDSRLASSPSTPSSLGKGKDESYFEKGVPALMRSYMNKFWKGEKEKENEWTDMAKQKIIPGTSDSGWDPMLKEGGTTVLESEDSTSSSENASLAGAISTEGGYHETESVTEERLYRLRSRNHSPPPLPPLFARQAVPKLPHLPSLPVQTEAEAQDLRFDRLPRVPVSSTSQDDLTRSTAPSSPPTSGTLVGSVSPKSVRRLTSILKPPPPAPTSILPTLTPDFRKWIETVQDRFGKGPGPRYEPTYAEIAAIVPNKKKGVTFGFEEVREFGATPRASLEIDDDDNVNSGDGGESISSELGHEAEGLALKKATEEKEVRRKEEERKSESENEGVPRKSWFGR